MSVVAPTTPSHPFHKEMCRMSSARIVLSSSQKLEKPELKKSKSFEIEHSERTIDLPPTPPTSQKRKSQQQKKQKEEQGNQQQQQQQQQQQLQQQQQQQLIGKPLKQQFIQTQQPSGNNTIVSSEDEEDIVFKKEKKTSLNRKNLLVNRIETSSTKICDTKMTKGRSCATFSSQKTVSFNESVDTWETYEKYKSYFSEYDRRSGRQKKGLSDSDVQKITDEVEDLRKELFPDGDWFRGRQGSSFTV